MATHAPPAGASSAERSPSAAAPWSVKRAAGRAALGAFIAVIIDMFVVFGTIPGIADDASLLELVTTVYMWFFVLFTIGAAVAAAVLEGRVPALRVPLGSAFNAVGHNRWIAAGLTGAAMGLIVGLLAETIAVYAVFETMDGVDAKIAVYTVIGYLIAEAIVGRRGTAASKAAA